MALERAEYFLDHLGLVCALGEGQDTVAERLFAGDATALIPHQLRTTGNEVFTGTIQTEVPPLPDALKAYDCRNHRLSLVALKQMMKAIEALKAEFGPHRIGVVLGSSTAGLDATEKAYAHWTHTGALPSGYDFKRQHSMGSVAAVVAAATGVTGPAYTLSTACTSSAKALISARDLLATGFCDAVITGGVDTLCDLTLNGFEALGALSRQPCLPMSANRSGLNIGEAAAFFIMRRCDGNTPRDAVRLIGAGESSDAHHMTAPHPEGEGAELAMSRALSDAGRDAAAVAYLNMHGTATPQNDAMEAKAVARVFDGIPCSSTKPFVGHTLGAAGAIEAAFCYLSFLQAAKGSYPLPPHIFDDKPDPDIPALNLVKVGQTLPVRADETLFMSNSFAFGGNNCSLLFAHPGGGR